MRRRELISLVGCAAVAAPFATRAQQVGKVHRVALIFSTSPVSEMAGPEPIHPLARAFKHTLRDLGYVEGRNLILEGRSAEGKFERLPDIVRELVSLKVDVIVSVTNPITRVAKEATQTVPIVMLSANPIEEGFIHSLARPGGNITGVTGITGLENNIKRVQLLKDILSKVSSVAFLQSKAEMAAGWGQAGKTIAQELGVKVLSAEHTPTDYTGAFTLIARQSPDALLVAQSAANFANRRLIIEFAAMNRLPAIYPTREYVIAGGLISYGAEFADLFRQMAGYVDRILKGAKPADLPVAQPSKFHLVINLKTAKALGLTIPLLVLARADEVIE